MTCRRAVLNDLPRLVQLAQCEHARSRYKADPFDLIYVELGFSAAITEMRSVVFISDSGFGFIVGMVQPGLLNRFWNAYELAWYSEDGGGMRLLAALTGWARKMKARDLVVSNYAGIKPPEKFARALTRSGFDVLGASYIKSLT